MRGQDPLRLPPLAGFQLITTTKKKKLATWSTRLASINPGLCFVNLIILLLKTFAKTVMIERIREEGWDIETGFLYLDTAEWEVHSSVWPAGGTKIEIDLIG